MEPGRISERQLIGLIIVNVLATGLIYVPSGLFANSGRDAYLTLPVSTLLSFPAVWLIGSLCLRYPQARALTIFTDLLGRPVGSLIAFGYVSFFLFTVLTIVVPGGSMIHNAFMPDTPLFVLIFLLTCLAGYAAYLGLEPLARFNTFVIPLMFLTFLVIGAVNYKNFNLAHLLPPLEHGVTPILTGMIAPVGWFAQIILALIFAPEVRYTARQTLLSTVIINSLVLEFLVVVLLLTMGSKLPTFYEFPTLQLARIATVGGSVLGYDALVMAVWVTAVSVKAALWMYAGIILLGDIFRLQSRRSLIPPLIIFLSISAYPGLDNIREMSYYGKSVWTQFAIPTFEMGIPLFLYVLSLLKQQSPKSHRR